MPAPIEPAPPPSPLPPELVAVLQTLSTLPDQLAAVQHQLAALTQRLPPPSVTVEAAHKPARGGGQPKRPTEASSTQRSRPPAHVEYVADDHYVVLCPKEGLLPFQPETPEWFAWLATQSSFRFVGKSGHFTAHHEGRVPKGAWRAHRHLRNHSYNLRLAPTHELTIAVLERAAAELQAHLT